MAFGGGMWLTQNKVLPGTYINFVSAPATFVNLSNRGYAAIGLELDWGESEKIFKVEKGDFQKNSDMFFGYEYTNDNLKELRDLFSNAQTLYCYRLNSGGKKATIDNIEAKYEGTFGNNISYSIKTDIDFTSKFIVETYLNDILKDKQVIRNWNEFKENNLIVPINKTTVISTVAKKPLTGGINGTITGNSHQTFLDKSEQYRFNVLGYAGTDETIKKLYAEHTKRMRDEVGIKFQTVLYNYEADYEGIINVVNKTFDKNEASLVYFVTGASASCEINKSLTNTKYKGSFDLDVSFTQTQLINGIEKGCFMFHKADDEIVVLSDINSFVSWDIYKNEDFYRNQVVRVIDQIATDIAFLFNKKYLGKIRNNESGRTSLWADIVAHHQELERLEAIQKFNPKELLVEEGVDKVSVLITDYINPVASMEKLYMVINVK